MINRWAWLLSLLAAFVAPAALIEAQEYRGHLRGRILQPDGQTAGGVALRVTSEATGEARRVTSAADGRYTVADLWPGTYRIEIDGEPPRALVGRTDVAAGEDRTLDLHLGLASVTASSDIRSAAIPADLHSASLTTRLAPRFLAALPLDGRDVLEALLLVPGVSAGPGGVAAGGGGARYTGYLVDGLHGNEPGGGQATQVQLDTIDELDVRPATYDASFGHTAGAQVRMVTRSGTNRPSGGLFGFVQTNGDRSQAGGYGGGPLAENRTFLFGNYQLSRADADAGALIDDRHLAGGRLDHLLTRSSHVVVRYGLDDRGKFDRRGQLFGGTFGHVPSDSVTNDMRFGVSRISPGTANLPGAAASRSYQVADTATWAGGRHLVKAGAEWYGVTQEDGSSELSASTAGAFVQDDWLALPAVSISAGVRYDRVMPADDSGLAATGAVSPRLGVAWTAGQASQTSVRAGYGIHRDHAVLDDAIARVDRWSLVVQRRIGFSRLLEAAYVAARPQELPNGFRDVSYSGLHFRVEQQSEADVTVMASYTLGNWSGDPRPGEDIARTGRDARHRVALGFAGALPFGPEKRWFAGGVAGSILRDMQLSGIFAARSGLPEIAYPGLESGHRTLDLALLKNVRLGTTSTFQLRAETFSATDPRHGRRARRHQFGGRLIF